MKTKDVEALNQVLQCLKDQKPVHPELYEAFAAAVSNCGMILKKQKLRYQENAPYHRQKTREWARDNPERVRRYRQDYQKRKKTQHEG